VENLRASLRRAALLQHAVGFAAERVVERLIGEGEVGAGIIALLVLPDPARGLCERQIVIGHARAGDKLDRAIEDHLPAQIFVEPLIDEILQKTTICEWPQP
jgi:hypothetical protein